MSKRHEIVLTGCAPSPLASYLKGLGLLRILTQYDNSIQAAWRGESLSLFTNSSLDKLKEFLLHGYVPTAILAPWNGGSGFYEKDNKTAPQTIVAGGADRLADYRESLALADKILSNHDRKSSPKGEEKTILLAKVRSALPDAALDWFDAAILLTGSDAKFPPLLGTGGNDGRLDFTNNFMQRLLNVMEADSGEPTPASAAWLELSLLGLPAPGLVKNAIGQFSPGQVGGPNATTGYEINKGVMNPWDFVLMIEGTLPFAAAAVRRGAQDGDGVLSYPFTVRATSAGTGHLGAEDSKSARGELWMPLWPQPASYPEVRALLAEGRVALGRRPARDALDFVRAVHRLGGYRGVDRFQRYGLLMRSGKAYLATPLERVQITTDPQSRWIDDLEKGDWLARFRRFSQGDNTANRFITLRHRLENLLFELSRRKPAPDKVQSLLVLLAKIQETLAISTNGRESVRPIPRLSAHWVTAANDRSTAFRIARSLAGLHGVGEQALPLRAQLFPVHPRHNDWIDSACSKKGMSNDPGCRVRLRQPSKGDLVARMIALLGHRLTLVDRLDFEDKPLNSVAGINLVDLTHFLLNDGMDSSIAALLPGLALCTIPEDNDRKAGDGVPPAAYSLCKTILTPNSILHDFGHLSHDQKVPTPSQLVPKLASGAPKQADQAIQIAWRRLRSSGMSPAMSFQNRPKLAGIDPRRLAAALLIPLTYGANANLIRSIIEKPSTSEDAA